MLLRHAPQTATTKTMKGKKARKGPPTYVVTATAEQSTAKAYNTRNHQKKKFLNLLLITPIIK